MHWPDDGVQQPCSCGPRHCSHRFSTVSAKFKFNKHCSDLGMQQHCPLIMSSEAEHASLQRKCDKVSMHLLKGGGDTVTVPITGCNSADHSGSLIAGRPSSVCKIRSAKDEYAQAIYCNLNASAEHFHDGWHARSEQGTEHAMMIMAQFVCHSSSSNPGAMLWILRSDDVCCSSGAWGICTAIAGQHIWAFKQ